MANTFHSDHFIFAEFQAAHQRSGQPIVYMMGSGEGTLAVAFRVLLGFLQSHFCNTV